MVIVNPPFPGVAIRIQKKLQKSVIDNPLKPNSGVHAYPNIPSGIYKSWTRFGKKTYFRTKLYVPTNNQWPAQQAWRAIWAEGRASWKLLTEEEKQVFVVRSYGKHFTGYNLFMKEYAKAHYTPPAEYGCLKQEEGGYIRLQNGGKIKV